MGTQIEFNYLSDKCTREILPHVVNILLNLGWEYNTIIRGEYTYWLDGPIWNFGGSVTKHESGLDNQTNIENLSNIIKKILNFYSPSICFGIKGFERNILGILLMVEREDEWTEVRFTIPKYEMCESLNSMQLNLSAKLLSNLFINMAIGIDAYCGLGGTEILGFSSGSYNLINKEINLSDLNYFSEKAFENFKISFNEQIQNYSLQYYKSKGYVLTLSESLFGFK